MCLIIDASVAAIAFAAPPDPDAAPIFTWLEKGGMIVVGGKLTRELSRISNARRLLVQFIRAGIAIEISPSAIDTEIARVKAIERPRSNDVHIIGLARVARSRLLYSHDDLLIEDFKNRRFLSGPEGKVYKNATHRRLLKESPRCKFKGV